MLKTQTILKCMIFIKKILTMIVNYKFNWFLKEKNLIIRYRATVAFRRPQIKNKTNDLIRIICLSSSAIMTHQYFFFGK